ncbi:MAG: hypothetical protein K6B46_03505 [Opitutales bacterium]|nr:hypothetical protein [Opitutales bacterium]
MNKALLTIAAAALAIPVYAQENSTPKTDLLLSAKFAYASHYVENGMQRQKDNLNATISAGYNLPARGDFATDLYSELFYMSPYSKTYNQINLTFGSKVWYAYEYFLDFGYTYSAYPNSDGERIASAIEMNRANINHQNTFFLGIGRDVELIDGEEWSAVVLSAYTSYACCTEDWVVKVSLEKNFSKVLVDELDLSFKATYGYSNAGDYFGKGSNVSNDYGYFELSAGAVYHLTPSVDATVGVAYDYNNETHTYNSRAQSTTTVGCGLVFRY